MPFLQRLLASAEVKHAEPDPINDAPADSGGDEELSDSDLEEVLGGLERIHFPTPIDLPELET